jgi:hypothetical protein
MEQQMMNTLAVSDAIGTKDQKKFASVIVGLERIRQAATDIDGFQNFIKEGKHLC